MPLEIQSQPFDISRRTTEFLNNLKKDPEYRYPDTRRRVLSEITWNLQGSEKKLVDEILSPLTNTIDHYSVLDWNLLMFWRETTETVRHLRQLLLSLEKESTSSTEEAILQRFQELHDFSLENRPPRDPDWLPLIQYRWYHAPLRDEAAYLARRLEELQALDKAS